MRGNFNNSPKNDSANRNRTASFVQAMRAANSPNNAFNNEAEPTSPRGQYTQAQRAQVTKEDHSESVSESAEFEDISEDSEVAKAKAEVKSKAQEAEVVPVLVNEHERQIKEANKKAEVIKGTTSPQVKKQSKSSSGSSADSSSEDDGEDLGTVVARVSGTARFATLKASQPGDAEVSMFLFQQKMADGTLDDDINNVKPQQVRIKVGSDYIDCEEPYQRYLAALNGLTDLTPEELAQIKEKGIQRGGKGKSKPAINTEFFKPSNADLTAAKAEMLEAQDDLQQKLENKHPLARTLTLTLGRRLPESQDNSVKARSLRQFATLKAIVETAKEIAKEQRAEREEKGKEVNPNNQQQNNVGNNMSRHQHHPKSESSSPVAKPSSSSVPEKASFQVRFATVDDKANKLIKGLEAKSNRNHLSTGDKSSDRAVRRGSATTVQEGTVTSMALLNEAIALKEELDLIRGEALTLESFVKVQKKRQEESEVQLGNALKIVMPEISSTSSAGKGVLAGVADYLSKNLNDLTTAARAIDALKAWATSIIDQGNIFKDDKELKSLYDISREVEKKLEASKSASADAIERRLAEGELLEECKKFSSTLAEFKNNENLSLAAKAKVYSVLSIMDNSGAGIIQGLDDDIKSDKLKRKMQDEIDALKAALEAANRRAQGAASVSADALRTKEALDTAKQSGLDKDQKIKEQDDLIGQLQRANKKLREDLDAERNASRGKDKVSADLNSEITQLKSALDAERNANKGKGKTVADLNSENIQLKAALEAERNARSAQHKLVDDLNNNNAELTKKLGVVSNELKDAKAQVILLTAQNNDFRKQLLDLAGDLAKAQARLIEEARRAEKAQEDVDKAKNLNDHARTAIVTLRGEKKALEDELSKYTARLQVFESKQKDITKLSPEAALAELKRELKKISDAARVEPLSTLLGKTPEKVAETINRQNTLAQLADAFNKNELNKLGIVENVIVKKEVTTEQKVNGKVVNSTNAPAPSIATSSSSAHTSSNKPKSIVASDYVRSRGYKCSEIVNLGNKEYTVQWSMYFNSSAVKLENGKPVIEGVTASGAIEYAIDMTNPENIKCVWVPYYKDELTGKTVPLVSSIVASPKANTLFIIAPDTAVDKNKNTINMTSYLAHIVDGKKEVYLGNRGIIHGEIMTKTLQLPEKAQEITKALLAGQTLEQAGLAPVVQRHDSVSSSEGQKAAPSSSPQTHVERAGKSDKHNGSGERKLAVNELKVSYDADKPKEKKGGFSEKFKSKKDDNKGYSQKEEDRKDDKGKDKYKDKDKNR